MALLPDHRLELLLLFNDLLLEHALNLLDVGDVGLIEVQVSTVGAGLASFSIDLLQQSLLVVQSFLLALLLVLMLLLPVRLISLLIRL